MPDDFRDIRLCLKQVMGILQSLSPDIDAAIQGEDDPEGQRLLAQARVGVVQATRIIAERIALWDKTPSKPSGKVWVQT